MRKYLNNINGKIIIFVMLVCLLFISGCSKKYTVTYQTDGGVFSDGSSIYVETVKKGTTLDLYEAPTKEGYKFLGWYNNKTNSLITIAIVVKSDCTLVAKWEKEEELTTSVKLTFDLDGGLFNGSNASFKHIYDKGDFVILPDSPTKEGYNFLGWYNKKSDTQLLNNTVIHEDVEVVAKWEQIIVKEKYTVKYDLDGGSINENVSSVSQNYDEDNNTLLLPEEPVREGYKFLGWYNKATNQRVEENYKVTTNLEVIAKWEQFAYKVLYNAKSGTFEDGNSKKELMVEKNQMLPYDFYPVVKDRIFSGWYDTETDELIYPGAIVRSDMEVYAKYKRVSTISNVTYHANGGQTDLPLEATYYEGIMVALPILEKEGFQFTGWYDNEKLTGTPTFYQDSEITGDTEYWASFVLIDIAYVDVVFEEIVPDVITTDLNFAINYCGTSIYWESSNYSLVNSVGEVSQTHNIENVTIRAEITFEGQIIKKEKQVTIQPLQFRVLDRPVAGYFYVTGITNMTETLLENLDIAYFAFANVRSNGDVAIESSSALSKFLKDAKTFKKYGGRIVLSIAGGADNFSNACRSKGAGYVAQNIVDLVVKYGFDGVDIDWEFPSDASDMQRMNALCQSLRLKLDGLVNEGGTPYLLTAAIPSSESYAKFDLRKLNEYLDYTNMMSYDMNAAGLTTHLCPLLKANNDGNKGYGIDDGIDKFTRAGFDKNKIIIGAAFYGKSYKIKGSAPNPKYPGLAASAELYQMQYGSGTITYAYIYRNILTNRNYVRYWDDKAKASYLYNEVDQYFITFEDEGSLIEKTKYAYENGVGIMFWEYGYDYENILTHSICETMRDLKNAN